VTALPGWHRGAVAAASLDPLASASGVICALALDHRDALSNAFARAGIADVTEAMMVELKGRVAAALAPLASTLLLDAPSVAALRRPGLGLLVPLEEQGHEPLAGGRLNRLLEDFGPADAARLGADGCKLLLYYRADHPPTAQRQRALVAEVAEACHAAGLALVVEPLVYRLGGEDETTYAAAFGRLVVAAARDLAHSGADLLKAQFPGTPATCRRVTEAAWPLPWTLLGGSDVQPAVFAEQLRVACAAGACGFIAGRPIWGGALDRSPAAQPAWLADHARPQLEQLVTIADTYARRLR
jgi:tagatose-1,6-bisphosphate aldolase